MLEWVMSASVLIILVTVSRKLLRRKISCGIQYALWLLVALRLLVPVTPLASIFSVANLLPESWAREQAGTYGDGVSAGAASGRMFRLGEEPDSLASDRTSRLGEEPGSPISGGMSCQGKAPGGLALGRMSRLGEAPNDPTSGTVAPWDSFLLGNSVSGKTVLLQPGMAARTVWQAGVCFLALWLLGVNGIFRRKVRGSRIPFEVPERLREYPWGKERRLLPVYVTDEISTPCMFGLLRPAIYITPRTAENSQVLEMVLRHERTHYRHGDHVWSAVRMLCLCLHWYNPLVWAAVRLSRQDGELACDEGALRHLEADKRRVYGEALLALSTEHKPSLQRSLNLATSMSDTKKQLKERLTALMTVPRMAAGTVLLAFLLAMGLVACTFTGRTGAREEEPAGQAGLVKPGSQNSAETGDAAIGRFAAHAVGSDSAVGSMEHPGNGQRTENREGEVSGNGQGPENREGEAPGNGQETDTSEGGQSEKDSPENQEERQEPDYRMPWVMAEEYTGYLDELDFYSYYRDQDYDGDGLTDRIYQEVMGSGFGVGARKMRVEFGNGEVLSFDVYQNSPMNIQSLDLDGDGNRELLFTTPNSFSTNPPSIGSDILLFTRQEDGYRQVEVALEKAPEDYGATLWEVYLETSYTREDASRIRVSWRVPGATGNLQEAQAARFSMDEEDMTYYEPFWGGRKYVPAYDAELIQGQNAFLRLSFEGLYRYGDMIWVDMTLDNGKLSPVSSSYMHMEWNREDGTAEYENVNTEPEEAATVYDNWQAQIREYTDGANNPVSEVTEGDLTRKLTFVETEWSVSAAEAQRTHEVLYWACQALTELEQWTGTQVTEVCYAVSEHGDFVFGLTPKDMEHDRTFYSRCYNGLSFSSGEVIEDISYSTDMDVWYSPVKQYITPPGYDKMTTQERLVWFFERSAIARGSKVEEVIYPWEGSDYLFKTDQGTYYQFFTTEGTDTLGKGLYLAGPYDGYPRH